MPTSLPLHFFIIWLCPFLNSSKSPIHFSTLSSPSLLSVKVIAIPLLRNANSLNLLANTSKSNTVSSKISWSGLNNTLVPCSSDSPIFVKSHKTFPLEYFCCHMKPSLLTVTSQYSDNALTTEAPTPWRPPDTLYPLSPPNFPPACKTV